MASTMADPRLDVHPRMVGMGAKAEPRNSGIVTGQIVARALDYAQIEVKEAAATMGYTDTTTLYRWIAGKEQPNFEKLALLGDKFTEGIALGFASACPRLRVRWTVEQAS